MLGFKGLNGHPWDQKRPGSSGGSRGGARGAPPPPLFLDQTEARRAEEIWGGTGPPLSQGLDDRPRLLSEGLDLVVMYVAGTMIKCPPTAGFIVIFNNNNNIY